uniref:Uncharacterized protein n=1 Tax=Solanum tuberosum TaxID=4113 RepID=M1BX25_SOLTU
MGHLTPLRTPRFTNWSVNNTTWNPTLRHTITGNEPTQKLAYEVKNVQYLTHISTNVGHLTPLCTPRFTN